MWVKDQGTSVDCKPYAKTPGHVFTPDRVQPETISMSTPLGPKPAHAFKAEMQAVLEPWEKESILNQRDMQDQGLIKGKYLETSMRKARLGAEAKNWYHFELGFLPEELEGEGRKDQILEAVKGWAAESHVGGLQGHRAAVVYDWHEDGGKPHIRVALSGLAWDEVSTPEKGSQRSQGRPELVDLANIKIVAGRTQSAMLFGKNSHINEEMTALADTLAPLGVGVWANNRNISAGLGLEASQGASASVSPIQTELPSPNQAPKTATGAVPRAGLRPSATGLDALEGFQLSEIAKMEKALADHRAALEQTQMAKQALIEKQEAEEAARLAQGQLTEALQENEKLVTTNAELSTVLDTTKVSLEETAGERDTLKTAKAEVEEVLETTKARVVVVEGELKTTSELKATVEASLEKVTSEHTAMQAAFAQANAALEEKTRKLSIAEETTQAQRLTIDALKQQNETQEASLAAERARAVKAETELAQLQARNKELVTEVGILENDFKKATAMSALNSSGVRAILNELQAEHRDLDKMKSGLYAVVENIDKSVKEGEVHAEQAKEARGNYIQALEKLEDQYGVFTTRERALVEQAVEHGGMVIRFNDDFMRPREMLNKEQLKNAFKTRAAEGFTSENVKIVADGPAIVQDRFTKSQASRNKGRGGSGIAD